MRHQPAGGVPLIVGFVAACATARVATPSRPSPDEGARGPMPVPASFATEDSRVFLRFDTARIRREPFAREVSSLIGSSATWRRLGHGSESDPVRDVDAMLCFARPLDVSGDGIVSDRWTFVLTHTLSESAVVSRLESMARASDADLVWRTTRGFRSATLPVPESTFATHAVTLTAEGEVVVAPLEDSDRIAARAEEHRRLRDAAVARPDPSLVPSSPEELASLEITTRPSDRATIELPYGEITPRVDTLQLVVTADSGQVAFVADLGVATEGDARELVAAIERVVLRARSERMVRLLGIEPILAGIVARIDGTSVHLDARLSNELTGLLVASIGLGMN